MGQGPSVNLTQADVEEVCLACNHTFDEREVQTLYWRFRSLDRGRKGFVTAEEFLAIPELSINPLAPRMTRMLDGCNFKDFVRFLSAFSPAASQQDKLRFMFEVYDVDGDGLLTHDDLRNILSYLVGGQLTEEQIQSLLKQIEEEAGTTHGIDFDLFQTFAQKAAKSFEVQVPTRLQISCGMSAAYRPLCPGFEEASHVHGARCDPPNAAALRTQRDVLCAIGTCLLLTLAEGVQPFY
eukprot:TRINITY_DN38428_c0_g2_i1.p1 TRINITY_DN38428_c0_g2~~TRINITY_DN38428_c0_g2_i1.p1  ORF type:complete len:238 (-),score=19.31 TRINITY_DN38428_c0_g2_i1:106-819(-)